MADGDLVFKMVVAVIDERTTLICLDAAGQIQPVGTPFDTLAGAYDVPPFHMSCRSVSTPWMAGFGFDVRTLANAELMKRPVKQRDKRKYKNTIPPPL